MLPSSSKETTANTHKRKTPQNHENCEHSSNEALPCEEVNIPPSKLKVLSLEPSATSVHHDICWIMDCFIGIQQRQQNCLHLS
jgi:hypothetical protein